jgi:hypothetical protein
MIAGKRAGHVMERTPSMDVPSSIECDAHRQLHASEVPTF